MRVDSSQAHGSTRWILLGIFGYFAFCLPRDVYADCVDLDRIERRISELAAAPESESELGGVLDQARRAVERARRARATDAGQAERAAAIAEAATRLAETRLARMRERGALRVARARAEEASDRRRIAAENLARAREGSAAPNGEGDATGP